MGEPENTEEEQSVPLEKKKYFLEVKTLGWVMKDGWKEPYGEPRGREGTDMFKHKVIWDTQHGTICIS